MSAETEFQRRIERFLDGLFVERRDHLANGVCSSHPDPKSDYAYRTGYLRAIKEIGEACQEIAKQMYGGEDNAGVH